MHAIASSLLSLVLVAGWIVGAAVALYDGGGDVVHLTPSNWKDTSTGVWLVEFYSPTCGYCVQAAPEVKKAATALKGLAKIGVVDMTKHGSLGQPFNVKGFPTFKMLAEGKPTDYNGQRTAASFVDAVTGQIAKVAKARLGGGSSSSSSSSSKSSSSSSGKSTGTVEHVTDAEFDDKVLNNVNELVVVFVGASWCGHCKRFLPEYSTAAKELANTGIRLVYVEGPDNQQVSGQLNVQGFPTVKAFPPGRKSYKTAVDYNGPREAPAFVQWAQQLFETHGGKIEVEVPEIVDQAVFDKVCGEQKKCVLVFAEDLYDSGAKGRNALLESVKKAAGKVRHIPFAWVSANAQPAFEQAYNLGFGFPAVLMLREVDGQKVGFIHRGKTSEDDLVAFASSPKAAGAAVKAGWPAIKKTAPWDGKDAPKLQEVKDDFDLDEFLKS